MRDIGLHLQINNNSLEDLVAQADRFDLRIFQCFLAQKNVGEILSFTKQDIAQFVALRQARFGNLYLHSSYWVNLADTTRRHHPLLDRELSLAKQLGFTHIVLHAGSSRGARNRDAAFDALAFTIERLLANEQGLTVVLENTAHGGKAVGGDLRDMRTLLKLLGHPEQLKFCIDIGHAHLYGYKVATDEGQDQFIALVESIMGWKNVALIHLNDTKELCGSKIDHHHSVGGGKIGDTALQRFIMHPSLINIPAIMEVPMLSEQEQKDLLEKVRGWQAS